MKLSIQKESTTSTTRAEADQPDLFRALHNAISSLSSVEAVQDLSKAEAIQRAAIFSEMFFSRLCAIAGSDDTGAAYRSEAVRNAIAWLRTVLAALYRTGVSDVSAEGLALQFENPRHRLILLVYSSWRRSQNPLRGRFEGRNWRMIDEYRIAKNSRICGGVGPHMPEDEKTTMLQ